MDAEEEEEEEEEEVSEAVLLEVDVLGEADAAALVPEEEPPEEPTTSLESVDAVSQADSKIVAAHIVKRRFIMEVPVQIR